MRQAESEEEYGSEDEESYEEECEEEEYESELTIDKVKPQPLEATMNSGKASTGKLSRKTSFSSFYQIDEAEEARLKQIAFERFMADQKSKNSEKVNTESHQESIASEKDKKKKKGKAKVRIEQDQNRASSK